MSEPADPRIADARTEVRQVRDWLLRPSAETMEACAPALDRAVEHIRDLSQRVQPANSTLELIQALTALASEIQSVHALLTAAGELHGGRLRRLAMPDPVPDFDTQTRQRISMTG